jgi:hypothetical protein
MAFLCNSQTINYDNNRNPEDYRFDIDQRPIVVDMGIKSGQQRSWMRIARMILVILVGLSVAVLPAAVGFAGAPQMASAVSMPDCDHHMHAPDGKTQDSGNDCLSMAGCVFHCFSFTGVAAAAVACVPVASAAPQPLRASDRLSAQLGSLPFRPPRI